MFPHTDTHCSSREHFIPCFSVRRPIETVLFKTLYLCDLTTFIISHIFNGKSNIVLQNGVTSAVPYLQVISLITIFFPLQLRIKLKSNTCLAMLHHWFKLMFSIPRREPMTRTEKFIQWSSLVAYCIGGFSFLAAPQLYNIILQLDYRGHSEGFIRLVGLGIVDVGLIFVVLARCDHKIYRMGTISASTFSRLLWVPAKGLMLIFRDMLPLAFALIFMALDSSLSLSTLVIWYCETEEPSSRAFFKELLSFVRDCRGLKSGGSILVAFILGVIQVIFWYVFVVRPDFAQIIFNLDQFEGFASRYLSTFIYLLQYTAYITYSALTMLTAALCPSL